MARPREELSEILKNLFDEDPHVYYSPPTGLQMKYPCITYTLSNSDVMYADNNPYITYYRYVITVIDPSPDCILRDRLLFLPRCSLDRAFQSDNLNHYVFTIYF